MTAKTAKDSRTGDKSQREAFIAAARAAECDENLDAFNDKLRKLSTAKAGKAGKIKKTKKR